MSAIELSRAIEELIDRRVCAELLAELLAPAGGWLEVLARRPFTDDGLDA